MDRKIAVTTSWVLVSGTLLLGGCMTPGFHNQEPPGFSATFQEYDRHWHSVDGFGPHRRVVPAQYELESRDLPSMSATPNVSHEEELTPVLCP
jgi:hypothetical protein